MIAVDTNVLIRYFMQDDTTQAAELLERRATAQSPVFISCVVLAELVWYLKSSGRATKDEIATVLNVLLGTRSFIVEHRSAVAAATAAYKKNGYDFADILLHLIAVQYGSRTTYSFDKRALRYPGFSPL